MAVETNIDFYAKMRELRTLLETKEMSPLEFAEETYDLTAEVVRGQLGTEEDDGNPARKIRLEDEQSKQVLDPIS